MRAAGKNKYDKISLLDFIQKGEKRGIKNDKLIATFELIDKDHDGKLSVKEIADFLEELS